MAKSMRSEMLRLSTFSRCVTSMLSVFLTELAGSGFYYKNDTETVPCFSCGREYEDSPQRSSLDNMHDPQCRRHELNIPLSFGSRNLDPRTLTEFLNERETFDGPVNNNSHISRDESAATQRIGGDETESSRAQVDTNMSISNQDNFEQSESTQVLTSATKTPMLLGNRSNEVTGNGASASGHEAPLNYDLSKASYPQFGTAQARKTTYSNWRIDHSHRPEDLVPAGFFYAGYADCVRCFYCGLGLKYWRDDDIPAYQHARFRPTCVYNRMYKGQEYIDRVQQDFAPIPEQFQVAVSQATTGTSETPASEPTVPSNTDLHDSDLTKDTSICNSKDSGYGSDSDDDDDDGGDDSESKPGATSAASCSPEAKKELRLVQREHTYLKERTMCIVCHNTPVNCVYLPCGHVVACQGCGDKADKCDLCKKSIIGSANIFFA